MDFLATPDTVTGTAGSATPGAPVRVGLLTDGTSPNDASKNWAKYYNMLLEEMRNIIVTFGGTPDDDNWHQAADNLKARLLNAGIDANLAGSNPLDDSIDLDDIVASGEYYLNDPANAPFTFGLMKVWREDVGVVYQLVQASNNLGLATRYLSAGVWTAWKYYVTADSASDASSFNAYPKLVAGGNGTMTLSASGGAHVFTQTVYMPGTIELDDEDKYALQFTFLGAGINAIYGKYITWSCDKSAGTSFTLTLNIFNDGSSDFSPGTGAFTWSVLQLTA